MNKTQELGSVIIRKIETTGSRKIMERKQKRLVTKFKSGRGGGGEGWGRQVLRYMSSLAILNRKLQS